MNKSLINGLDPDLDHKHLLIKAYVTNPPKSEETLINWLREVVAAIDMKIVLGPFAKYVDSVGNVGITGAVVIETSHLAIHVWEECNPGMIQMDVYSCKSFDPSLVAEKLKEFGLISHQIMFIDRNADFVILEQSNSHQLEVAA